MYLFFLLCVGLAACHPQKQEIPEQVIGLAPVYAVGDWQAVRVSEPQPIRELGKMYYNLQDLLVFDIANLDNIRLVNRRQNVFPQVISGGNHPEGYRGFFECVDPQQGVVVYWEERLLQSPQCWR